MAGGMPLDNLVDLFNATSQAILTPENWIINEPQFRTTLLRQIMKAHDMIEQVQGGDSISDFIYFDESSTYADYEVNEVFTPHLDNHLTSWSIPWRFTKVDLSFAKQEKGLQNVGQLNRGARAMVFKRIIYAKWMNAFTSLNNGFERGLFAQPNATTMEATGGKTPYSVFVTIHQFGATAGSKPTATVPPGFTTIQQINPTTQARWRNPVEFYTDILPTTTTRWTGWTAMMKLYTRLAFEDLVIHPEYGEPQEPDGFIMTSVRGLALIQANIAPTGDFLRSKVYDPGVAVKTGPGLGFSYQGVPIRYVEKMDTAEVWPGSSGTVFAGEFDSTTTESGAATNNPDQNGPRFVFIVPKYYNKVVHSEHFLEQEPAITPPYQPFNRIIYFDNWHNNCCRSRQRAGGVVAPNGSVAEATYTAAGI